VKSTSRTTLIKQCVSETEETPVLSAREGEEEAETSRKSKRKHAYFDGGR
jgi:hypothetical protein